MSERDRIIRWNEKEDLVDEVKHAVGVEPPGLRKVLAVLAHPEVIKYTLEYFKAHDTTHVCTRFEAPWDCARDSESNYKSIADGWAAWDCARSTSWVASPSTRIIPGDWCQPCRRKALGEEPTDELLYTNNQPVHLTETWLDEDPDESSSIST